MDPILLACSVQLELEPLLRRVGEPTLREARQLSLWDGLLRERPVIALATGMGKTNAASALTAVLERHSVAGVVGFGVAGAYTGSRLRIGDVAIADREHYGDEGVETAAGWISCEGIGIPLLTGRDGVAIFNEIPVDVAAITASRGALLAEGRRVPSGPFVTVSTCSGTADRGARLAARFEALCESMEGAAYAHVAALYDVPFLGVRGISNLVEDRDVTRWRLTEAAEAVAETLPAIVDAWPHPHGPTRT